MLLFFIGVFSAVISSTYFLLPLYLQGGLHFTGGQIGLLYAILNLNTILVAFPVGVIGDRYPARVLTRLGLAGTAVCLWGMAGTGRFWPFLAVFWGFGLSLSLFRQSLDILLFKENPDDAPRRFGEFNAWRMGGMMLGTLAGGLMVYLWKFPLTLQLFGLGLLIMLWPAGRLPLTGGVRAARCGNTAGTSSPNRCCSLRPGSFSSPCIGAPKPPAWPCSCGTTWGCNPWGWGPTWPGSSG